MIERLMCAIFGHKYTVEKHLSHYARKIGCTRCNRKWAMNDQIKAFVEWDGEFEEMYSAHGVLGQKEEA
jgi:hypothetical protein